MPPFPHTRDTVLSGNARHKLDSLPAEFGSTLTPKDIELVVDAFQILDVRTGGAQAPKSFQALTAAALHSGQNVLVTAGCGAGKTLAMALPIMLLAPGKMAITIVPLKLLQRNHVRKIRFGWYVCSRVRSWSHMINTALSH